MLVLELMGEAVGVVGIGVLLLLVLLLGVLLLLLLGVLLLLLRARVTRLLLLISSTRIGGVVATVFAWGAHSCERYRGELDGKGGSRRRRSSRGVVNGRGRGGRRKMELEKEMKQGKR